MPELPAQLEGSGSRVLSWLARWASLLRRTRAESRTSAGPRMRVEVTREDIARSFGHGDATLAVAEAAQRAFGCPVRADLHHVRVYREGPEQPGEVYLLPHKVTETLIWCDGGYWLKPFRFTLQGGQKEAAPGTGPPGGF